MTSGQGQEIIEHLNRTVKELNDNFNQTTTDKSRPNDSETILPYLKFITEIGSVTATLTKHAIAARGENLRFQNKLNHFITSSSQPVKIIQENATSKIPLNHHKRKQKIREKSTEDSEDFFGELMDNVETDETIPMTRSRRIMENPSGADVQNAQNAIKVVRQFKRRTGIVRTYEGAFVFAEEVREGGNELDEAMVSFCGLNLCVKQCQLILINISDDLLSYFGASREDHVQLWNYQVQVDSA